MTNNQRFPIAKAAADPPQTPPMLTPEQVVEQLRALLAQIPDVPALTTQESGLLRKSHHIPFSEVQAAINVVGASKVVVQAVGREADDVRELVDANQRWTAVENELRGVLNGVSNANLIRRQRASVIAIQAYGVATQLARNPENASIIPHVQEMKRLKAIRRRKVTTTETPAPETPAVSKA